MKANFSRGGSIPLWACAGIGWLLACTGGPVLAPKPRPELAHIRVEAGDIADRDYLLLGSIEWPELGKENPRLRCNPDRLRARALEIYGNRVDGIVEFASWKQGRQSVCTGNAVQFTDAR